MKCEICEREDESVDENNKLCDRCWYGMRMAPEEWKKELESEGITAERGMGCQPFGDGFICGDPYRKAPHDPAFHAEQKSGEQLK